MGAAYGTWKSAVGLSTIANLPSKSVQTEMVMKSIKKENKIIIIIALN
jgi:hypothetical protein